MIAQFANTFKLIGPKADEQDLNAATLSYDDDHIENNAIISASDDSDPLSYSDDSTPESEVVEDDHSPTALILDELFSSNQEDMFTDLLEDTEISDTRGFANNELVKLVKLTQWQQDAGVSREHILQLRNLMSELYSVEMPSLRHAALRLQRQTGIKARFIDCCHRSCVAYTGEYASLNECPRCGDSRWSMSNKTRQSYAYFPLADRLRIQWKSPYRARIMKSYRQELLQSYTKGIYRDIFDGSLFRKYHQGRLQLFQDPHDIAFSLSLDGVQVTNMKNHQVREFYAH